jgi:hypothetical protein
MIQALEEERRKLENLQDLEKEYNELDSLLQDLPQRRTYDIMVGFFPISSQTNRF